MRKLKIILLCLLTLVSVLCLYAGCGKKSAAVSGIEDGQVYVLGSGDIAAQFSEGSATLSKDGGAAAPYTSGTLITSAGEYVLVWTGGERTETYSFTVKHDESVSPEVSGVTDGQTVEYGTTLKPAFDRGDATLSKDGGAAAAFTSGTEIKEIGKYVLTVTNQGVSVTVNFEIAVPAYSGQMTDEFLGDTLNSGYANAEDSIMQLENGALRVTDVNDKNGYCLFRRQFTGLNLNEYPYVELSVLEMQNIQIKFAVDTVNPFGSDGTQTFAFAPGKVYLDLKAFAESRDLDTSSCDLWLQISFEGMASQSGNLTALIDHYKSVKEIPAEQPGGRYEDTTAETLGKWVAYSAKFQYFEGVGAMGTIIGDDNYGRATNRVQLNTKLYPYLIVDVEEAVEGWKIEAFRYENNIYQGESSKVVLIDTKSTGRVEINLQSVFGEHECVDLRLDFYIVGKSSEKNFILNGLWTQADPLYAPVVSGIGDGDVYNLSVHGSLAINFDKGDATLSKDGGAAETFENGGEITEEGEYMLTVLAGESKATVAHFTVINRKYADGTIEDFLTESRFTVEPAGAGTFAVSDEYDAAFAKTGSNLAKISTRLDFDFTHNSVVVFELRSGTGFNLKAFSFEILDDVGWYHVYKKSGSADYTEQMKEGETIVGYRLYFKITAAVQTGGNGSVSWIGSRKENLKLSLSLESEEAMTVYLNGLSLAATYPGEGEGGEEGGADGVIGTLLDDYDSLDQDEYTIKGDGATAVYNEIHDEIVLTKPKDIDTALGRMYTYDFKNNGKYLALVFETNGYTPDAGFSLILRDEGVANWPQVKISYPDFAKVVSETLDSGRTRYTCFIEVGNLTETGSGSAVIDYTEKTAANLVTEIGVQYGDKKVVYLKSFSQTDTLPA